MQELYHYLRNKILLYTPLPQPLLNKIFWEVQCDSIGLTKVPAAGIPRPSWNQRQAEAGNRMLVKMREYSDKVRASNKPKVSLLADWTRAGLHPPGFSRDGAIAQESNHRGTATSSSSFF